MRNCIIFLRNFAIVLTILLTLTASSQLSTVKRDLISLKQQLDQNFRYIHELNLSRQVVERLPSNPWPIYMEYFRVHKLVSDNVDDATLQKIFDAIDVVVTQYTNVDREILMSIIAVESRFNPLCSSDKGQSLGLMQVQPRWHSSRAANLDVTDWHDIYGSVLVGCDYFSDLVDRYGCYSNALIAYNAGPSVANRCTKRGEITNYVVKVLSIYSDISGGALNDEQAG